MDNYVMDNDKNRPGIVHRIDKNTTGVIIVAKNMQSLLNISGQFKQRTINKQYLAIIHGVPKNESGKILKRLLKEKTDPNN